MTGAKRGRPSGPAKTSEGRASGSSKRSQGAASGSARPSQGRTTPVRDKAATASPARPKAADTRQGQAIIWSSWAGTLVFVLVSATAAVLKSARLPAVIADLALFFAGCGVFLVALAAAAGRSREREITLWSLFLLEGVAPGRVRRALLGALAVEVVVALATAWITAALAFGCLVPMWALGHCGLWGARSGAFGPREAPIDRRRRNPKE